MNKILILTLHADPAMPPGVGEWGGTHTYMRELLLTLGNDTFELVLITRRVYPEQPTYEKLNDKCTIHRIDIGDFGGFDKRDLYFYHEESKSKIMTIINEMERPPSLIHSVYWNSGQLAKDISKELGIKYVHSVISNARGRNSKGALGTFSERIAVEESVFQNAERIICVANSEVNEIVSHYNIDRNKFVVAGQYIHPSFHRPAHNALGHTRSRSQSNNELDAYFKSYTKVPSTYINHWWNIKAFIYVGRISLDKGVDSIIRAWHKLKSKYKAYCPPLWIVGGSPIEIDDFRNHVLNNYDIDLTTHEKTFSLKWWGYLDEEGISALYLQSGVLITHSRYEPGGRVALEAMSQGVPVIATPNGFASDSIINWFNGFLVPFEDINILSKRLEHFIIQPYLSNVLGLTAKEKAQSIYKEWNFTGRHKSTYLRVICDHTDKNERFYNKDVVDYFSQNYVNTYPFENETFNFDTLRDTLMRNGLMNFSELHGLKWNSTDRLNLWTATRDNEKITVKKYHDQARSDVFFDNQLGSDSNFIISKDDLYKREHEILSNLDLSYYKTCNESLITVHDLDFKSNPSTSWFNSRLSILNQVSQSKLVLETLTQFGQLDTIINMSDSLDDIQVAYSDAVKSTPYNYTFGSFSVQTEFRRIKQVLKHGNIDDPIIKFILESLSNLKICLKLENKYPLEVSGGSNMFNHTTISYEKARIASYGLSYAALCIEYERSFNNSNEHIDWHEILDLLAFNNLHIKPIIMWSIILTLKEIIVDHNMLKEQSIRNIKRVTKLIDILNELN